MVSYVCTAASAAIGRNNLDKDLAIYAAVRFIYLRRFKREVVIAAILQLGRVHTHISFVTTHVKTRLAATVVSCISNVQSLTELAALTLNKSNNDRWEYEFPLPQQLKSRKLIYLAPYLGRPTELFVTGSVTQHLSHATPFRNTPRVLQHLCELRVHSSG